MENKKSKQTKRHLNIEAVFNVVTAIIVVIVTMVMILLTSSWLRQATLVLMPRMASLLICLNRVL